MSGSPHKAAPAPEPPLTLETLPPADTDRWVAQRKAKVVAAVQAGLLSVDEALSRYKLTLEELTSWQRALYRHGLQGLKITHRQICRLADRRRAGQPKAAVSSHG